MTALAANLDLNSSVIHWASRYPQLLDLLDTWGSECCCSAGRQSLQEACWQHCLDVHCVFRALRTGEGPFPTQAEPVGLTKSLSHLCDHIETRYHARLRAELARGSRLMDRVVRVHGDRQPRLFQLAATFTDHWPVPTGTFCPVHIMVVQLGTG